MSMYEYYSKFINEIDKLHLTMAVSGGTQYEIAKSYVLGYNDGRMAVLDFLMNNQDLVANMNISELIGLLNKYSNNNTVTLNISDTSKCNSAECSNEEGEENDQ